MAPFETKIKTDIPRFQHVDFWYFGLILIKFGLILVNVGQMFRTIWGQTCSERSACSERSEHEHCSGPTQDIPIASAAPIGVAGRPNRGRLLLSGVRRCRRRSAGRPSGPDRAPEGPWGCRRVPYGSVHQSCINTGQLSDPSNLVGSRSAKSGFRRKPV